MPKKRYTPIKAFILGVMNTIPKPMSGYELISFAKEWRYDHYIKATNASFYYSLKQLEKEDFIKEIGSKQKGNRPEQTIYKLLNKGKKELHAQISYFLSQVKEFYFEIDAITPFILLYGATNGKQQIIEFINTQIEKRKKMFKHADEGEQLVQSHYLYDLSPFYILPLKHWRLHNEAELKWLEYFKKMVEDIDDFREQYSKTIKRASSKI